MYSRLNWTQEEDLLLRNFRENNQSASWVAISKALNKKVSNIVRTPKQCRDRYINFAKFDEKNNIQTFWDFQQVSLLNKSLIKHGFKWKIISTYFPERSENFLKNKFYSLLRKLVRKVNQSRKSKSKAMRRQLTLKSLKRVLELARQPFESQAQQKNARKATTMIFKAIQEIQQQVEHSHNFFIQLYTVISACKQNNFTPNQAQSNKEETQSKQRDRIHQKQVYRLRKSKKSFENCWNNISQEDDLVKFRRTLQNQKLYNMSNFMNNQERFGEEILKQESQKHQNPQQMQFFCEEENKNIGRRKQISLDQQMCQIQNMEYRPHDFYIP